MGGGRSMVVGPAVHHNYEVLGGRGGGCGGGWGKIHVATVAKVVGVVAAACNYISGKDLL